MSTSTSPDSETKLTMPPKESEIPVTPVNPRKYGDSSALLESPTSPFFSKEDQIEIHKSRQRLEMEVITLEQKLKALQERAKDVKINLVSQGELTLLKAQTREKISNQQHSQLSTLIDDYIETIRSEKAYEATSTMMDQKVREESARRGIILEEYNEVLKALDMSDIKCSLPALTSSCIEEPRVSKYEIERTKTSLNSTYNSITAMESNKRFISLQSSAALEIARTAEAEWNYKSIGTASLRAEIQGTQKALSEQEIKVNKLAAEVNGEKEHIVKRLTEIRDEETEYENKISSAGDAFSRQLQDLELTASKLRTEVAEAAMLFDRINEEKGIIETRVSSLSISQESPNSDDDDLEYEVTQITATASTISGSLSSIDEEKELVKKRDALKQELEDLRKSLNEEKRRFVRKETESKEAIRRLNERYMRLKRKFVPEGRPIPPMSPSSSELSRNIEHLISRIDNSIADIRAELVA